MKILVVDDEQDVKDLFEQRFRKEIRSGEHEIMFAFSGNQALQKIDKMDHSALIILSDINMPGMSGLELLETIKKEYQKPPLVMMMITAYGDDDNYQTAIRLGADDFLTKPLDFGMLKSKLNTLV